MEERTSSSGSNQREDALLPCAVAQGEQQRGARQQNEHADHGPPKPAIGIFHRFRRIGKRGGVSHNGECASVARGRSRPALSRYAASTAGG
jgi:hypothetical protein